MIDTEAESPTKSTFLDFYPLSARPRKSLRAFPSKQKNDCETCTSSKDCLARDEQTQRVLKLTGAKSIVEDTFHFRNGDDLNSIHCHHCQGPITIPCMSKMSTSSRKRMYYDMACFEKLFPGHFEEYKQKLASRPKLA